MNAWVPGAVWRGGGGAPCRTGSGGPVEIWETTGLKTPESALPDPAGAFAYVSNIDGDPTGKDGNGFIAKVSLKDGKISSAQVGDGPRCAQRHGVVE